MRRTLPVVVAVLAGAIVLLDMALAPAWLGVLPQWLLEAAQVLGACALLFAAGHLALTHAQRLVRGDPRSQGRSPSGYSAILLAGMVASLSVGVAARGTPALSWIFRYLFAPLQASLLGLMSFVLVHAFYRAGRLPQRGARTLVILALVILLLQALASPSLSPLLPALRDWLQAVPVMAGARGILLGVALGTAVAGLRILLGLEQPYSVE